MREAEKYLIVIVLLGLVALGGLYLSGAVAGPGEPAVAGASSLQVIIDTSVAYATPQERHVATGNDFFNASGLAAFPASAGAWTGKDVTFDDLTYSFYGTDEITGREYACGGDIVYMHLIHGPKLYWHDPRNCYIFSGWTIGDSVPEPVVIGAGDGSYLPGDDRVIYVNRFTAEKDGAKFVVLYWYVFKDRVSVYDVSMAIMYVPYEDDPSGALALEKSLVAGLFSRDDGQGPGSPTVAPGAPVSYAEDNPPQIARWLVAGPWYSGDAAATADFPPSEYLNDWPGQGPAVIAPGPGEPANGTQWAVLNSSYGIVHLDSLYAYNVPGYAYAFVYVYVPSARDALLQVSSDDGARVWLNGVLAHSRVRQGLSGMLLFDQPLVRGSSLEDTVPVRLAEGWNRLLVEVYQWKGSWEFNVQFRGTAGGKIDDLRFSVDPQECVPASAGDGQGMIWQIGYADGGSDEFSPEQYVTKDYYVGESFREFPRAVSTGYPVSRVHFRLTEAQAARPCRLLLRPSAVDQETAGFIRVNVSVNGQYVSDYQYPRDWLTGVISPDPGVLRPGDNVLEMQRAGGASYVSWDYVRLE